jgi:hypothetical protein
MKKNYFEKNKKRLKKEIKLPNTSKGEKKRIEEALNRADEWVKKGRIVFVEK